MEEVLKHLAAGPPEAAKPVETEVLLSKVRGMYGQLLQRVSAPAAEGKAQEAVTLALGMQHALDDLLIISLAGHTALRAAAAREKPMRGSGVPHPAWSTF